jgi:hypothetical protein
MATTTRHARQVTPWEISCSNRACDRSSLPGDTIWTVTGDIEYEALCAKCHEQMFPAIDYAMTKEDG